MVKFLFGALAVFVALGSGRAQDASAVMSRAAFSSVAFLPVLKTRGVMPISTEFALADFRKKSGLEEVEITADAIQKVTLVYSAFKEDTLFDQQALNQKRLQNLEVLFPDILRATHIQWDFVEQTGCGSSEECSGLFHGFIVHYIPPPTKEEMDAEVRAMKRILQGKDPFVEDSASGAANTLSELLPRYRGGAIALEENMLSYLRKVNQLCGDTLQDSLHLSVSLEVGIGNRVNASWVEGVPSSCFEEKWRRLLLSDTSWQSGLYNELPIASVVHLEFDFHPNTGIFNSTSSLAIKDHRELAYKKPKDEYVTDTSVLNVLTQMEAAKHALVLDVTGSMSPYLLQALLWIQEETSASKVAGVTFFNDGNYTPNSQKKVGSTGGIFYQDKVRDFDAVVETAVTAMLSGNGGGDIPENNLEALLFQETKCQKCDRLIMIADNFATPRDMELLYQLKKPVDIILCGGSYFINPAYLNIAHKTQGKLFIDGAELSELQKLKEGDTFEYKDSSYLVGEAGFMLSTSLYEE